MTADQSDRINKLIAAIDCLTGEVGGLRKALRAPPDDPFIRDYRNRRFYVEMSGEYWWDQNAKGSTDEPRTALGRFLSDWKRGLISDVMGGFFFAVAVDVDNAVTDVRASRSDIEAIQNDSDLRADFLEWQRNQGGR